MYTNLNISFRELEFLVPNKFSIENVEDYPYGAIINYNNKFVCYFGKLYDVDMIKKILIKGLVLHHHNVKYLTKLTKLT